MPDSLDRLARKRQRRTLLKLLDPIKLRTLEVTANKRYRLKHPEEHRISHQTSNRNYYRNNIEEMRLRVNACTTVSNAIKRGLLVKPTNCSQCNESKRIQAHHYLGYAKEHRLDIIWLCEMCHRKTHNR